MRFFTKNAGVVDKQGCNPTMTPALIFTDIMPTAITEYQAQYQFHKIFNEIREEYQEEIDESGETFKAWLDRNKDVVGERFLMRVDEYCGIDEAIESED